MSTVDSRLRRDSHFHLSCLYREDRMTLAVSKGCREIKVRETPSLYAPSTCISDDAAPHRGRHLQPPVIFYKSLASSSVSRCGSATLCPHQMPQRQQGIHLCDHSMRQSFERQSFAEAADWEVTWQKWVNHMALELSLTICMIRHRERVSKTTQRLPRSDQCLVLRRISQRAAHICVLYHTLKSSAPPCKYIRRSAHAAATEVSTYLEEQRQCPVEVQVDHTRMSEREVNDHERICVTLPLAGRLGPVRQAVHGLMDSRCAVAMVSHGPVARAICLPVARAILVGQWQGC